MSGDRTSTPNKEAAAQILELMKQGYSLTAASGALGIHRQRVYEWEKIDPELADTVKIGQAARTYKLESDLLAAKDGPMVTSRIFALKNSAPDEWRDKVTTEVEGKLQTEEVGQGAAKLVAYLGNIAERSGTSGEPAGE